MKGNVVAIGELGGHLAAARMVDGKLDDLLVDGGQAPLGTVFRAVCDRPIKGAGGMFLRLPGGERGYLRGAKGLAPGQPILVQTVTFAEESKANPVTQKLVFKSRYAIVTPNAPGLNISRSIKDEEERVRLKEIAHEAHLPEGAGLILRTQCQAGSDDEIAEDIAAMATAADAVLNDDGQGPELLLDGPDAATRAWIEWEQPDMFDAGPNAFEDHGVLDALGESAGAAVDLGGGATAFVEPTRALVAVDVNTGADGSLAAGLKANMALAQDLPRQLRIRGLGGQITLDLAPMPKKDRRHFETALKAAFKKDPIDTALAGWTPLGHFELQRKRERLPVKAEM